MTILPALVPGLVGRRNGERGNPLALGCAWVVCVCVCVLVGVELGVAFAVVVQVVWQSLLMITGRGAVGLACCPVCRFVWACFVVSTVSTSGVAVTTESPGCQNQLYGAPLVLYNTPQVTVPAQALAVGRFVPPPRFGSAAGCWVPGVGRMCVLGMGSSAHAEHSDVLPDSPPPSPLPPSICLRHTAHGST
jgi:hypothetical protein